MRDFTFDFIEREIRKKTFGVLTTIDRQGRPHSTGVLYGVSRPESDFHVFVVSGAGYAKVRNVRQNPSVSFVVTFPHYYLRFVPANYVMFRGNAEVVPSDDTEGQWAFDQKRILRMNQSVEKQTGMVFIKIHPEPTVFCYGLGIGLNELRKHLSSGSYKVRIPEQRLKAERGREAPSDSH